MPSKRFESAGPVQDTGLRMPTALLPRTFVAVIAFVVLTVGGCDPGNDPAGTKPAVTSTEPVTDFGALKLTDAKGESKTISEWAGGKKLVMIVSRGYFGTLCPFCSAQAHDLAMDYSQIQGLGANLVLVFPVENSSDGVKWEVLRTDALAETALEKTGFPFPVLIDTGLAIVDRLGIRGQLAKPSTYILDSSGNLKFSYVGRDPGDRPRVGTILEQLKQID